MPQYLIPKAHCKETGQTVKSNDLGKKFTITKRADAELEAQRLAQQLELRTKRKWVGYVDSYTVDSQGRTGI